MSDTTLTKAYQLAVKLKELAPWTYMDENDIFGVRMPDTGKLYFISIMGAAGVHYGMAAYEGAEGLMGFWDLHHDISGVRPSELLLIPHMMVSFEDRDVIEPPLRKKMKELGFAFRGQNAWPDFRHMIPGFVPEMPEEPALHDLVTIMKQSLDMFERAKADRDFLYPEDDDEDTYLVRAMTTSGDAPPQWQDTWQRVEQPEKHYKITFDTRERNKIAGLPRLRDDMPYAKTVEADIAVLANQVAEPGKKAFFPFMFLVVSKQDGTVLHHELLTPEKGVDAMHARFPEMLIKAILKLKVQPHTIELRHPLFYQMAKQVLHPTKIKIVLKPVLNQVEEVLQSMQENLG